MAPLLTRTRLLAVALACATGLLLAPLAGQASALTCAGKKVTILGTPGNDLIVGKGASDVIYGGGGNDHISGGRNGNDTICGGPGNDTIHAGRGYDHVYGQGGDDKLAGERGSDMLDGGGDDDQLSGSRGSDHLYGGSGDDSLISAKGSDKLSGGPGNDFADGGQGSDSIEGSSGDDKLLGDKGNDTILGGEGNDTIEGNLGDDPMLDGGPGTDLVFAGPGTDHADGGEGNGDVVRGDAGTDTVSGGSGSGDIVSFASATREGVKVNLATNVEDGDGHDVLSGFEDVVGSAQADTIVGDGEGNRLDGGVGNDTLQSGGPGGEAFGGPGNDACNGFKIENSCGPETGPPAGGAYVVLNRGLDGSSLVVQGSQNADAIRVSLAGDGWTVSDSVPVFAGSGCANPPGNADAVTCAGETGLSLIVISAGSGSDEVVIDPGVPAAVNVKMTGNAGNDTLVGGAGPDVIEAGEPTEGPESGHDTLVGNGGSDTLYTDPGSDQLYGGPGSDLLVGSVLSCQGHTLDGGPGEDTVNYDRTHGGAGVRVQLGGTGGPRGCATPDRIVADESLEGSEGPDVLIGDNHNNGFMGHLGADVFIGKGGVDYIDAAEGDRDKRIDCGGGKDEVLRDKIDPAPINC
jgi:Ca2+-binding RTX toxin-like protein